MDCREKSSTVFCDSTFAIFRTPCTDGGGILLPSRRSPRYCYLVLVVVSEHHRIHVTYYIVVSEHHRIHLKKTEKRL